MEEEKILSVLEMENYSFKELSSEDLSSELQSRVEDVGCARLLKE